MLLVTGATGQLGRGVIESLLRRHAPGQIAALARDPARASDLASRGVLVKRGDYADAASLAKAFDGVERLLLISTNALEGAARQHSNVLQAAKRAGVRHVVFTSIVNRSSKPRFRLVDDYRRTEDELARSGIAYTILRNGYYMDMLPLFIGDARRTGRIRYPAGQGRTNFTARADLAEAAARVLAGSGHENRVYEACGPIAYAFADVADALSEAVGKRIDYVDIAPADYAARLRAEGMSPVEVELMAGIAESIRASEGSCSIPELESLLGRKPTSLREFLAGISD